MKLVIVESPTKVPKNSKSLIWLFFEDPRFCHQIKDLNKIGTKTII
ncbi:MAG: hypothetical protein G01um10143_379 [Parcubacteria group bacterium Gr01-1014_3]|nr:MAG: hypothetical protein G01um10143_379 [Parcubacteria group bacterium Gr01-1014_3]